MRAPTFPPLHQRLLFVAIFGTKILLDEVVELADGSWISRPVRPSGKGWRHAPLRYQRERHTRWMRLAAIPRPRRASSGGGGWRQ
jgi:hypothetical protein